ncbi:MlaD family protein [Pedobacter cryoconitis]|uniref:Phospholipid/cholesterol/gamma-HCH transport system substrate-binding protein n=1 Tax=Pedobacter cryoconitis TaxID=188932 RepID=A0A327S0G1_9SPHI|nr:MlaD family protein [Pedobacter cryoconitis]RAJ22596.1 phospholipid/cholesterol/gamma-HCH transport system substrate-binding protein [Pedobacter cryoconitis]
MRNPKANNIKLGAFVLSALVLMIFAFFIIGKNNNIFGNDFRLKVQFSNLNGLTKGNNVLFSGLQAGTVKEVELINDSTIEVTMQINSKVKSFIHKNALAAVGTEGLMGNKVVNISPVKGISKKVEEGDLLKVKNTANMDEIIAKLSKTNDNVAIISEVLKGTVLRIDSSAILKLINDQSIGINLKASLKNIYKTTSNANEMTIGLNHLVNDIKKGKGTAGLLLTDTSMASTLKDAIVQIKAAGVNANQMTNQMNTMVKDLNHELTNGKGPLNRLLKDSLTAKNISLTIENLQKGTDGFNQNMEALKHNFLFRGYFRKLDSKKKEEQSELLKSSQKK